MLKILNIIIGILKKQVQLQKKEKYLALLSLKSYHTNVVNKLILTRVNCWIDLCSFQLASSEESESICGTVSDTEKGKIS